MKLTTRSLIPILLAFIGTAGLSADTGLIRFVNNHWPPWTVVSENEKTMDGIDIQIIKTLFAKLNLPIQFQETPWIRSLKLLETGDADLISSIYYTPDREKYIYFLQPAYWTEDRQQFYTASNSGIRIRTYEDLNGHTIGIVRSNAYFPRFDEDENVIKVIIPSQEQQIRMTAVGTIDLMVGPELVMDYYIRVLGYEGQLRKVAYNVPVRSPHHLGISRKSPLMSRGPELEFHIKQMIRSGEIRAIADSFLLQPGETQP